ncbi:hypothetical protein NUU61_004371 [Penicillium alfredii]|uniref:Uncharacterized protein n=1 Tax=Penicillium alfredii TaxID=1506179 RepID=A0A9W9KDA7_9EURO|nr:uncharacterized protein NUU61_004371 [Penicillium alfredii]KAJ5102149.1 hypothetical protein NUU61_004371 [Penicillium alfredii]
MNQPIESADGRGHGTNPTPIQWSEIFSRHESVLASHLELLDSVKGHIAPDGDAFRTVSTMARKTVQAMGQLKVVRKHMRTRKKATNLGRYMDLMALLDHVSRSAATSSSSGMNAHPTPTPQSTDSEATIRRKRSRADRQHAEITQPENATQPQSHPDSTDKPRAPKRKRPAAAATAASAPGEDAARNMTPSSFETEDISEEVRRRLRIKEERRRKEGGGTKSEKRKRDSLASNESASPGSTKPKKKRVRRDSDRKRDGDLAGIEADGRKKRRKSQNGS